MTVLIGIASVGLIAAGLFLLIRSIRRIVQWVASPVLLKLPLTQQTGQFTVAQPGRYAIWQSGRTLQRVPIKMELPLIQAWPTGQKLMVHPSLSGVWVNNGWEGRVLAYTFWAPAGQYQLEVTTPAMLIEGQAPYFLEIRERKPGYGLVLGILGLIVAAFCLLTGMIIPFL